jgi:hypothetical protein
VRTNSSIETRLRQLWRTYTTRLVVRGIGWLLTVLVALIFVDLLLDWTLDLAGKWRLTLLLGNMGVLGWIGYQYLFRLLPRFDTIDEALRVERVQPDLNGLLISSLQFQDEAAYGPQISRDLMRAVRQQAEARVATMDFRAAAQRLVLRAALLSGGIALALLIGFGAWRGEMLAVLAQRMINPGSRLLYPTLTTIEVLSGDIVTRRGEPVTLSARATGVVPTQGRLLVRYGALSWETVPLTADAAKPGHFEYLLPNTNDDIEYYFRAGDGRSSRYRVSVMRPPQVAAGRVKLTYPAYTKMAAQEVETLNLKVPEGTQVYWDLKFSERVEAADLMLEGAEPAPMKLADKGRAAALQLPAQASRAYQVRFRWRLGEREYVEPGARYYMQVIPDADPQVTLLQPVEDAKATLKKVINLAYSARDDYGLNEATIVFSVNDGAELRHKLGALDNKSQVEKEFTWPVTQQFPGLQVGDMLTFAIEVTDSRPGQAGKNRSLSRRVQFVTDADYLAFVLARQRKTLGQLRPLYIQEKEAVKELEKLREKKP